MTTYLTQAERDEQTMARFEADLISGLYFTRRVASNKSVPLGGPPIASRHWADIMGAIAQYAKQGDRAADVAAHLFGRINQYATPNEVVAQVADVLAAYVRNGYYDVRRATGPDPGRPSSHQHDTTLRDAIHLALLMVEVEMSAGYIGHVPGLGWCLHRLVTRENMIPNRFYLPKVAKALEA